MLETLNHSQLNSIASDLWRHYQSATATGEIFDHDRDETFVHAGFTGIDAGVIESESDYVHRAVRGNGAGLRYPVTRWHPRGRLC